MKLPNDFIHIDGTGRPQCWVRNEMVTMATIYHDDYSAVDLRRLAKWCVEAAEYLEWKTGAQPAESSVSDSATPRKARSGARSSST